MEIFVDVDVNVNVRVCVCVGAGLVVNGAALRPGLTPAIPPPLHPAHARTLIEDLMYGYQHSVTALATKHVHLPDWSPVGSVINAMNAQKEIPPAEGESHLDKLFENVAGLVGDLPAMIPGSLAGGVAGGAIAGPAGAAIGANAGAMGLPAAVKAALIEYGKGNVKDAASFWSTVGDSLKEGGKQALVGAVTAPAGMLAGKIATPLATRLALGGTLSRAVSPLVKPLAVGAAEDVAMTGAGSAVEGKPFQVADLIDNAALIGGLHLAHAGAGYVKSLFGLQKTLDGNAFYKALGDTAEASKLRERLPDGYREYIQAVKEQYPNVDKVLIPVEQFENNFKERGVTPDKAAELLGVSGSLDEARKTNGNVEVPLETWAEKVGGNHELFQSFKDDVKFGPDDFTARELNERANEINERIKKLAEEQKAQGGEEGGAWRGAIPVRPGQRDCARPARASGAHESAAGALQPHRPSRLRAARGVHDEGGRPRGDAARGLPALPVRREPGVFSGDSGRKRVCPRQRSAQLCERE